MGGFAIVKKAFIKHFFKKVLPACLFRCDLQSGVCKLFKNKCVSRYLTIVVLWLQKIVPHNNNIINKT